MSISRHGRIGIDLGGTKIEVIAIGDSGQTLLRERIPTPAGDYEATVAAITQLARKAQAVAGPHASIGIGTPGSASKATALMINANSTVLIGKPLQSDLERALGRRIRMAND